MAYFIRYTGNPTADLERKYSFVGYNLHTTKEQALRAQAEYQGVGYEDDFDLSDYIDENEDSVAQDNTTGLWGSRRSGLCGYGEFEDVDEAIANMDETRFQYHGTQFCAIFEGVYTHNQELDGLDDGVTFRPIRIAALFELQGNDYVRMS